MKKLISIMLAVMFCLSLSITALIPASAASSDNPLNTLLADPATAADGTLLYKVQFGYTYGVYQSHEIIRDKNNKGAVTIHEDELGITFTLDEKYDHSALPAKKWWYGDSVEGLSLAEGNRYTIKYKIRSNENSVENTRGTGNNGFFFHSDAAGMDYETIYGFYGNLTCVKANGPFCDLFRSGKHVSGEYISSGSYIYFNKENTRDVPVPDAEGYVDCSIEVDGFKYYLYINGKFFDCTTIAEADRVSDQLAVIFYTYSSGGSLKDVEIYKGLSLTTPEVKDTTAEGGTTKDPYADDEDDIAAPTETTTETPEVTTVTDEITSTAKADDTTIVTEATENKSCGGVTLFAQLVAVLGCGISFVAIRKKH